MYLNTIQAKSYLQVLDWTLTWDVFKYDIARLLKKGGSIEH